MSFYPRRPDPPTIAVGGMVETYAVDGMARFGKWPAWFDRMVATHYRGTIPARLFQAVNARKLELQRRRNLTDGEAEKEQQPIAVSRR